MFGFLRTVLNVTRAAPASHDEEALPPWLLYDVAPENRTPEEAVRFQEWYGDLVELELQEGPVPTLLSEKEQVFLWLLGTAYLACFVFWADEGVRGGLFKAGEGLEVLIPRVWDLLALFNHRTVGQSLLAHLSGHFPALVPALQLALFLISQRFRPITRIIRRVNSIANPVLGPICRCILRPISYPLIKFVDSLPELIERFFGALYAVCFVWVPKLPLALVRSLLPLVIRVNKGQPPCTSLRCRAHHKHVLGQCHGHFEALELPDSPRRDVLLPPPRKFRPPPSDSSSDSDDSGYDGPAPGDVLPPGGPPRGPPGPGATFRVPTASSSSPSGSDPSLPSPRLQRALFPWMADQERGGEERAKPIIISHDRPARRRRMNRSLSFRGFVRLLQRALFPDRPDQAAEANGVPAAAGRPLPDLAPPRLLPTPEKSPQPASSPNPPPPPSPASGGQRSASVRLALPPSPQTSEQQPCSSSCRQLPSCPLRNELKFPSSSSRRPLLPSSLKHEQQASSSRPLQPSPLRKEQKAPESSRRSLPSCSLRNEKQPAPLHPQPPEPALDVATTSSRKDSSPSRRPPGIQEDGDLGKSRRAPPPQVSVQQPEPDPAPRASRQEDGGSGQSHHTPPPQLSAQQAEPDPVPQPTRQDDLNPRPVTPPWDRARLHEDAPPQGRMADPTLVRQVQRALEQYRKDVRLGRGSRYSLQRRGGILKKYRLPPWSKRLAVEMGRRAYLFQRITADPRREAAMDGVELSGQAVDLSPLFSGEWRGWPAQDDDDGLGMDWEPHHVQVYSGLDAALEELLVNPLGHLWMHYPRGATQHYRDQSRAVSDNDWGERGRGRRRRNGHHDDDSWHGSRQRRSNRRRSR